MQTFCYKAKHNEDMTIFPYSIIKPIWVYGVEIWGCASKTNISIIQRSQSKILRMITNAPWYVSNITLRAASKGCHNREKHKIPQQNRRTREHTTTTVTGTTKWTKTKKELASRPERGITRTYRWISTLHVTQKIQQISL
jgi:hypothetical protein